MKSLYRHICIALVVTALISSGNVSADEEVEESVPRPSWEYRDSKNDENIRGVTEMMIVLKPHARTNAYRHYDWGNERTEDRYEEVLMSASEAEKLSKVAGIELTPVRVSSYQLLKLPYAITPKEARVIGAKLAKHPDVESAEPNTWGYNDLVPNDAFYNSSQWNLQQSAGEANLPPAWDATVGGTDVVVAVLDSGILPNHTDLIGRTLPGYDFVSDSVVANDGGGGRDIDPTDPGNWVTQADIAVNPISIATSNPHCL